MSLSQSGETYPPGYLEEYSGNRLLGVSILFIILDTLAVSLRFYTRSMTEYSNWGWDDTVLIPALITNLGMCAHGIVMVKIAGVGYHLPAVSPPTVVLWAKTVYALPWIYFTAVLLPKLSILLTYLRVFIKRRLRQATYLLMAIIIATWLSYGLVITFQCKPVDFAWNKTIVGGSCINIEAFYKAVNGPLIITDVFMIALPIPTLWHLKVSRIKKVGLTFAFAAGSVGTIASCVRLAAFAQTDAYIDNTWASVELVTWSVVEPGMYLIAACLPALRPLVNRYTPQWIKEQFSRQRSSKDSTATSIQLKDRPSQYSNGGFTKLNGYYGMASSENTRNRSEPESNSMITGPQNMAAAQGVGKNGVPLGGIEVTRDIHVDVES